MPFGQVCVKTPMRMKAQKTTAEVLILLSQISIQFKQCHQLIVLCWPNASLLPMLPKHTQLQNSTLALQVQTPMLSWETKPSMPTSGAVMFASVALGSRIAGDGTILGLISNNMKVPKIPTIADKMKPAFDRSIRYQSTGLTSARVRETCIVDCQGNFL